MIVEEKCRFSQQDRDDAYCKVYFASSLISPTYIERRRFDNRKETGKEQVLFIE
jgi:hypothetical protein